MAAIADQQQQQQQQQPNFHALSGHLRGISIEVDRCSNLVAVREANALEAIARLNRDLNNAVATLTASITGLRTEIGTINTSVIGLGTEINTIRTDMNTIRTDINTIRTDVHGLRTEMDAMNTTVGDLGTTVGDLGTMMHEGMEDMRASMEDFDYNARARTMNSTANRSEYILHRLRNTTTHELVDFPQTLGEVKALLVGEVNRYLEALGQTPTGSAEEKKVQLLQFIGVSSY